MARLIVVTSAPLADGFRLAGCETLLVDGRASAARTVREVASSRETGLLLITSDVWAGLDERLQGQLERLAQPVVMPIPAGAATEAGSPGRLLGEMLQRAIGYRIELGTGGAP
jgi:vacuolar-type H+-ATPase subunit F/Vma7